MIKPTLAVLAASLVLSGCASTMLSDSRIQENTAFALNEPSVTISNRHDDGLTNTFYMARTSHGSYSCTINGGGILAMGMTNAPQCMKR